MLESRRKALGDRLADDALTGDTFVDDVGDSLVLRGSIREALMRMRPEDREVVTLAAWQGFTTEQLATVLDCTKALASLRLHRARKRFAKLFGQQLEDPLPADGAPIRPAKGGPMSRSHVDAMSSLEQANPLEDALRWWMGWEEDASAGKCPRQES